jgi:hypothetical protein
MRPKCATESLHGEDQKLHSSIEHYPFLNSRSLPTLDNPLIELPFISTFADVQRSWNVFQGPIASSDP